MDIRVSTLLIGKQASGGVSRRFRLLVSYQKHKLTKIYAENKYLIYLYNSYTPMLGIYRFRRCFWKDNGRLSS